MFMPITTLSVESWRIESADPVGNQERREETDAELNDERENSALLGRLHDLPGARMRDRPQTVDSRKG
jgi:hypothetical protein